MTSHKKNAPTSWQVGENTSTSPSEETDWESDTQDFESKMTFKKNSDRDQIFKSRPIESSWLFNLDFFWPSVTKKIKVVETKFHFACISGRSIERAFQKNMNSSRMSSLRNRVEISRSEQIVSWPNVENIAFFALFETFCNGNFLFHFFRGHTHPFELGLRLWVGVPAGYPHKLTKNDGRLKSHILLMSIALRMVTQWEF